MGNGQWANSNRLKMVLESRSGMVGSVWRLLRQVQPWDVLVVGSIWGYQRQTVFHSGGRDHQVESARPDPLPLLPELVTQICTSFREAFRNGKTGMPRKYSA